MPKSQLQNELFQQPYGLAHQSRKTGKVWRTRSDCRSTDEERMIKVEFTWRTVVILRIESSFISQQLIWPAGELCNPYSREYDDQTDEVKKSEEISVTPNCLLLHRSYQLDYSEILA